ncbi:MAG: 50S ribosomal protein L11 methyltransferase [Rhodocyclaceae bacterium]|nr:50S ribosomal protein L11 methyltransferase [Rhodocyclaceae bacterium]MBX3671051.1 50S ribosomal protein L11 methyltransferase [Rhodocyclaceae bacterium]
MSTDWQSVALLARSDTAEALSDALLELGALSVSIEDADAGTERECAQYGEPGEKLQAVWPTSRVIALFAAGAELAPAVAAAAEAAGLQQPPAYTTEVVEEQDWVRRTQSQFDPIPITEKLWIVPSWHHAPDPQAVNIVLDPGLAFGTGSHPTTRLCLEWLSAQVKGGERVLDYGCGSGILAIVAAKLGAARVLATDIDPLALQAAAANAAQNAAPIALADAASPLPDSAAGFDLVVANILANPLCVLAPILLGAVRPGGRLALSGVLQTQVDQVCTAYAAGCRLEVRAARDGWVLLEGLRLPC